MILLAGCSARQTIVLEPDGSGTADISVTIEPVFGAYLEDLALGFGGGQSLLDPQTITAAIEARPGLAVERINAPTPLQLELTIAFDDISRVIVAQPRDLGRFLRFERTSSFRRLSAEINGEAIRAIGTIAGIEPIVIESLVPTGTVMSAAEYRDYLGWALEEYERDRPLEDLFREAVIVTDVSVVGSVMQINGGSRVGELVRFELPLVDAITATIPRRFSLVFSAAD